MLSTESVPVQYPVPLTFEMNGSTFAIARIFGSDLLAGFSGALRATADSS